MTNSFLVGASECTIDVTPDIVDNTLHPCMTVRFDEKGSELKVKALAMSFGQTSVILVVLDLRVLYKAHCDVIRKAIAEQTTVGFNNIIISVTHSHSTPNAEPLTGPCPFFKLLKERSLQAATEAFDARKPSQIGHDLVYIAGASFNQRVPMDNGGVKFVRDWREALAAGGPVDPRLNVIRVDKENGKPIACWVRFAAHPACVIFDAPLSAEFPGYMADELSGIFNVPVFFGYGAAGDVNMIPMFGKESDSARLGHQIAETVSPVFEKIRTHVPKRFVVANSTVDLPLAPMPSLETLDEEIRQIEQFKEDLAEHPDLEWVIGINCKKDWPVEKKKATVTVLAEWAALAKKAIKDGKTFPKTWPSALSAVIIDDLSLVYYAGEPFTRIGLVLAARSPLTETLLLATSNGCDGYVGMDEDIRRGGYETYTNARAYMLAEDQRPLPYAPGAAEHLIGCALKMINDMMSRICEAIE